MAVRAERLCGTARAAARVLARLDRLARAGLGWRLARTAGTRPRPPGGPEPSGGTNIAPHERRTGDGSTLPSAAADPTRATFGQLFAVGEFRALWLAQVLSVAGDQLARVALSVLVYDRTRSALLAAVAFAASVVPASAGGLLLGGLADRFPRRAVMIVCDVARAALVVVMAVPGVPLAVLVCLLALVTLAGGPFLSARAALYPEILAGDTYVLGNAVTITTFQLAQAAGFAVGGAAVALLGIAGALSVDAATFAASALLVALLVRARPAARTPRRSGARPAGLGGLAGLRAGFMLVFGNPALRLPMLFGWLAAFYNVPEAIAAPLAGDLGGGATWVGLLLAAATLGSAVGAIAFSRLVTPPRRQALIAPLAVAACAVLVLFALHPGLTGAVAILAGCGLLDSYQVAASAAFVTAAPPAYRAQAFGVAQGGMNLGQGIAMVTAGALAQLFTPSQVIAAAGALGAVAAAVLAVGHRRRR